ncbi:MAG: peptidase C14 [Hyphomicrobiales bacterium]|nr:MAG: peptidase C14 [Hyphomicrobiales bacterium]
MQHHITRRGLLAGTAVLGAGSLGLGILPAFAQTGAGDAGRTNHALLVAVTAYPNLPPKASLVGPNNDASLVRQFLLANAPVPFAPENVTVLADGIDSAGSPTRTAIRGALDRLTGSVKAGDFVYLQFSGHGTQQPAIDPSLEPDGMDECFLPADTGMWQDRSKGIPNALVDKEIRDHLQAIRDKGAFIWAVFDCCHSGTMTRAVTDGEETERKIDFTDLGIPEAAMAEAAAQAGGATRGMDEGQRENSLGLTTPEHEGAAPTGAESIAPGGLVAFFAAQNTETTPEMPLPKGDPEAAKLGLFTFTLFSKIAENPAMTYRQLGQAVLQAYSGDNRMRPTPLFEGDLDRQVFGMTPDDRIAQWAIKVENGALEIPAGQLHRLSKGTRLAILPSPGSTLEEAVGYVEVQAAKNLTSRVAPVAHEGLPALAVADIPAGAWARLTELALGFELVVARPGGEGFAAEADLINAALDKIVEEKTVPVNLRLVGADEAADLKLAVMSEMDVGVIVADQAQDAAAAAASRASLSTEPRVWLLPPSTELSLEEGRRSPSLPLAGASAEEIAARLGDDLVRIFRATSLSRLSAASEFRPQEVEVGFKIRRSEAADTEPLRAGTVPVVHPDDEVHIAARNASPKPVDINVLYIGSDYSISHMYAERLSSGSEIDLPLLAFTDSSYGIERMVVVLSEAQPQTPVEDLSFLEQVGVRQATRSIGGGAASFGDLLREVAAAPETRGAARLGEKSGAKGAVLIFPLETTPRA